MRELALNIGSFTVQIPSTEKTCWLNLDILDLVNYAREKGFNFKQVDVRKGLPFEESSVEQINCSHLLEHFDVEKEGIPFLKECHRALKHKGALRLGTPDLRKLVDAYLKGEMDRFNTSVSLKTPTQPEEYRRALSQADKFWRILTRDHKTCHDFDALRKVLSMAGFTEVGEAPYDKELDMFPELSLYVTAMKKAGDVGSAKTGKPDNYKQYLKGKIKEGRQG